MRNYTLKAKKFCNLLIRCHSDHTSNTLISLSRTLFLFVRSYERQK